MREGTVRSLRELYVVLLLLGVAYSSYALAYSSYVYLARYYAESHGVDYDKQAFYQIIANVMSIIGMTSILWLNKKFNMFVIASLYTFLLALSPTIALSKDPFVMIPLSIVIMEISFQTGIIARNLMIIEIGGSYLGRILGFLMTINSLMMIIGPVAGYKIKEVAGYTIIFLVSSSLFLISGAMILSVNTYINRNLDREFRKKEASFKNVSVIRHLHTILKNRKLIYFIIFASIDRFSYNLWAQLIFALTASENIRAEVVSITYSIQNLSWFVSQYIFGLLSDKINPVYILFLSEFLTGSSAYLLAEGIYLYSDIYIVFSFILIGLSIASWIPSYNKYIQINIKKDDRTIFMISVNILASLTGFSAPLISVYLKDLLLKGLGHLYIATILHIINASIFLYTQRRER
jgi:hypothetical protein